MRSLQLVLTSILTFILIFEAHAEEPKISTSFVSGLIEQPIISSIYRDEIGLLWIGTQEGLYRFDGTKVTIFNSEKTNKNWISSSHVRGIIEAPNGNMIIAALDGDIIEITRTSGDIETIIRLNSNISLFQETNGGRVWITSDDKIFSYNQALRKATPWASIPKMQGEAGEIYALLESSSRDLYVGSNLGLSKVDSEGTVSKTIGIDKLGLPDFAKVSALAFDPSGNLIVGSSTGHITILNSVTHKLIKQKKIEGKTPKYISKILPYKNSLLIGTDKGLLRTD